MKHIQKFLKNEPKDLKEYRKIKIAKPTYKGYVHGEDKLLKKALAEEQGWICAYCNRDIHLETITVEHYIPQKRHKDSPYPAQKHKDNELNFLNMLATCRDNVRDCSGLRGNAPLVFMNPSQSDCEKMISYRKKTGGGYEIYATKTQNAAEIQHELDNILQLNTDQLCRARQVVVDRLIDRLRKNKKWNKMEMEQEVKYLQSRIVKDANNTKGFSQYCMVAIDYLQQKLSKPYYQQ